MRLSQFILENREPILREWEAFARTCSPAASVMGIEALRDHADEMLLVIAADLSQQQGKVAQAEKSKGNAPEEDPGTETAAEEHGAGRADSGFSVEQMVAEYRALRASVIRLWTKACGKLGGEEVEDLTRFNEAIDQSLAESVSRYNQDLEKSKEMFLAILGHDMRTPLGAIFTSSQFILETGDLNEAHRLLLSRIASSATRTIQMVGDLLDFTRSRLGGGIPIVRGKMQMEGVVQDVVNEVIAGHPDALITVTVRSAERGSWDEARIRQALGNLIGNAVQHGTGGGTVNVEVRSEGEDVIVAVQNPGVIPADQINGIFNPMKSREPGRSAARGPTGSLGLGLYIAERIIASHDGHIDVGSSPTAGTTFTVHLPRDAGAAAAARHKRQSHSPA